MEKKLLRGIFGVAKRKINEKNVDKLFDREKQGSEFSKVDV